MKQQPIPDRCDAAHNPGFHPYTAQCTRDKGHTNPKRHLDHHGQSWYSDLPDRIVVIEFADPDDARSFKQSVNLTGSVTWDEDSYGEARIAKTPKEYDV